jgi:two-component system sensor histidine kinase YesM
MNHAAVSVHGLENKRYLGLIPGGWRNAHMLIRLRNFINASFGRRLLFFLIPYIVLLLVSVTLVSFYAFFNTLQQEKEKSAETLVSQISANFDYYFSDIRTTLAFLSVNNDIHEALTRYDTLSVQDRYFLNNRIGDATGNVNVFKSYIDDVITIGKNGYRANLPTSSALSSGADLLHSSWLSKYRPSENSNFYFTPPHKSDYYISSGPTHLVVSAILPVIDQGRTVGYLQGDLDYDALHALLDRIYQQNDIEITMLTSDGVIVFDRDNSRVNTQLDQGIVSRLMGQEGSFITNGQDSGMVIYSKSPVTDWYLVASIPYSALLSPGYSVSTTILLIILPVSLLIALITVFVISKQIREPWSRLVHRIETTNVANYSPAQIDYGVGEIAELGNKFEAMLAENNALIEQVYVAEIKKKNAELQALREQITPHFVYNSLQVIKAEAIFAKNRKISQSVTALANLLRYSMDNRDTQVTVAEELNYIRDYLDIYMRRFIGKFDYTIEVPEEMMGCTMQKMTLQPLVENCIKHGFEQTKSGGCIQIRGHKDGDDCVFEVWDNGKGICADKLRQLRAELTAADQSTIEGIGLFNVHQRIVMERGPKYGITEIDSTEGEYTRVVLTT